jgi:hypothetical protein
MLSSAAVSEAPKKKKRKKPLRSALPDKPARPVTAESAQAEQAEVEAKPEVAPLPGEGTPEGELLRDAARAFEAGDYAMVRKRAAELNSAPEDVRQAAQELAARTAIDPVQIVIVVACAAVLAAIVYVWVL